MAVPPFHQFMLPFLQYTGDGNEHAFSELFGHLASHFNLSEADLKEVLPSGRQTRFRNRVYWARAYLGQARLLDLTGRGRFRFTERAKALLAQKPDAISSKLLAQYPEFQAFHAAAGEAKAEPGKLQEKTEHEEPALSPEEQLETSYQSVRAQLAQTLLAQIMKSPPDFFEQLVVDLLVGMGYGGSRADAGQAVGQTGDNGIDGIIKEDRLGLDIVYLQAKRWDESRSVSSREVRDFTGSLEGHGANKGVLITTSRFTKDALDFAKRLQQKKIVLIDGEKLTELMIDYGIGVTDVASYTVKKIDPDYFGVE